MSPIASARRRLVANAWGLACLTAALALPGQAGAADGDWPTRQVTFLQPYAPGTALDAMTRYIAGQLGPQWKVPIVVEHKAGANGVIGTEAAARAAPDGQTFLFTGPGYFTNELLVKKLPYDPIRDFKPVARIASVMLVLAVPKASPANSVAELIALAKRDPGKLSYASGGNGSSQHVSAAVFAARTGIDVLHVPYKTQAQALTDTVGGQVDFSFVALATAASQLKAGNLKALAVTGPRRSQSLPELPTIAEAGVPGYEFFSFTAVYAPAGTPDDIVRRLSDAIGSVVRTPGFTELLRVQGIENDFADWRAWGDAQVAERKSWADMMRAAGAKAE